MVAGGDGMATWNGLIHRVRGRHQTCQWREIRGTMSGVKPFLFSMLNSTLWRVPLNEEVQWIYKLRFRQLSASTTIEESAILARRKDL